MSHRHPHCTLDTTHHPAVHPAVWTTLHASHPTECGAGRVGGVVLLRPAALLIFLLGVTPMPWGGLSYLLVLWCARLKSLGRGQGVL